MKTYSGAPNSLRPSIQFPQRMTKEELIPSAYYHMYRCRVVEDRIVELYRNRQVKGTVTLSTGNEASAVGMASQSRRLPAAQASAKLSR